MNREFEYWAMRALAESIASELFHEWDWKDACDTLAGKGIGLSQRDQGFVAYPLQSSRRNPACLVLDTQPISGLQEWTSMVSVAGFTVYVYEAGTYDMARDREKPAVRRQAKG